MGRMAPIAGPLDIGLPEKRILDNRLWRITEPRLASRTGVQGASEDAAEVFG